MTMINAKQKSEKIVDALNPINQPEVATLAKGDKRHLNWMGGPSFDIKNPLSRLKVAASSCFFGEPMYYHGQQTRHSKSPARAHSSLTPSEQNQLRVTLNALDPQEWRDLSPKDMLVKAIDEAILFNAEETLKYAAHLRNELHFRTTPQVILVRAANSPKVKGTGLISKYAPAILERLDEVCVQMAYQLEEYGKTIPKNLKRAWAARIERAKAYELAKYRMEGREVNLYDVINLTHPAGSDINKLMRGELKLGADLQTWESIRSSGGSWADAANVMGHMALLRNLRNLQQDKALTKDILKNLIAGAATGKQMPFRYLSAYKAVGTENAALLDALETCLENSLGRLPQFPGKVMSLVDNSGSARGAVTSDLGTMTMAEIGNLMGVLTARVSDEGHVGVFGNKLVKIPIQKKTGFFETLTKVNSTGEQVGQDTEHGIWLFWKEAIEKKQHWDTVFVYSDMQASHGGLYGIKVDREYVWNSRGICQPYIDVPKLISTYRKTVNPDVVVVSCQIAGYQDTIIPEYYDKTVILGGWSPEILRFAAELMGLGTGPEGQEDEE
jgi:hypothetical protein